MAKYFRVRPTKYLRQWWVSPAVWKWLIALENTEGWVVYKDNDPKGGAIIGPILFGKSKICGGTDKGGDDFKGFLPATKKVYNPAYRLWTIWDSGPTLKNHADYNTDPAFKKCVTFVGVFISKASDEEQLKKATKPIEKIKFFADDYNKHPSVIDVKKYYYTSGAKKEYHHPLLALQVGESSTPAPAPAPKSSHSESFFKNYLMNGGPPLKWKYENIDFSENLKDQTLADICGADEIFEVTYGHAITDIFGLNMAAIGSKTEAKKKEYEKSYEASIKKMFMERQPEKKDEKPALTSFQLKEKEKDCIEAAGGGLDDDEEGAVKCLSGLYTSYKYDYDKRTDAKDRLRDWILGVRKDAGVGWSGIDVINFVGQTMGYGNATAQARYNQLKADDYDF